MNRRDFFGIIAAPLLRQMVPPVPMAGSVCIPNVCADNVQNYIRVCRPSVGQLLVLSGGQWNPVANIGDITGPKI